MPGKEIVGRRSRRSSSDDGVIQPSAREPQARANVFGFEIRHLFDDLFSRESVRQEIEDIAHPDPHPTDAGTPTALLRVNRDAIHQLSHILPLCKWSKSTIGSQYPSTRTGASDDLEYIGDDELVEITPESIRLRKKVLEPGMRK